jgi:hypothetical protein
MSTIVEKIPSFCIYPMKPGKSCGNTKGIADIVTAIAPRAAISALSAKVLLASLQKMRSYRVKDCFELNLFNKGVCSEGESAPLGFSTSPCLLAMIIADTGSSLNVN